jgi:hypothetical protein
MQIMAVSLSMDVLIIGKFFSELSSSISTYFNCSDDVSA